MDHAKTMKLLIGISLLSLLLVGCATEQQTLYYWGNYEDLLYAEYNLPGQAAPEYQIAKLEEDIQKSKSTSKPLPPGFYGHLGYQYLQDGKFAEARSCFETESHNYPESTKLMTRFTEKLR